jgi:hypothetical protein
MGVADRGTGRARRRGLGETVEIGQVAGGRVAAQVAQYFRGGAAEKAASLAGADASAVGRETARRPRAGGDAEVGEVAPVELVAAGRGLVGHDARVGEEFLAGLLAGLLDRVLAELLEALLGDQVFGDALAHVLEALLDGLLGELRDEFLEDLLDRHAGRGDQATGRG